MDQSILESVIHITKQRDVDSLEYSLVATLAEMVAFREAGIYKLVQDGEITFLEEVVKVSIDENKKPENSLEWGEQSHTVSRDPDIQKCLDSASSVEFYDVYELHRLIMPIVCDKKVIAALNLISSIDLRPYVKMLQGMVRVYENYLFILNESERDKLTGLFNRRTFDKKLDRLLQIQRNKQVSSIISRSDQEKRSLKPHSETWLAMIDVDDFKQVNDRHGHLFGDAVLLMLSHKMKLCFRHSDYLFRFGGEEFVVILEPNPKQQAFNTLDRFRDEVAKHVFPLVGKVTVSIGYARITDIDYPPAILDAADRALYYAKDQGKNAVYNYETLVMDKAIDKTCMGSAISTG